MSRAAVVDVTVKETAGVGATAWPTTVVFPLEPGRYQNTSSLVLRDVTTGSAVPAQFEVIERWVNGDNSIRHVVAHFQATAPATGTHRYELDDTGGNPQPPTPVSVAECSAANAPVAGCPGAGYTMVTTGPLRFTVNEVAFDILDTVWYDLDGNGSYSSGERIVTPSASHGGRVVACDNVGTNNNCSQTEAQDDSMLRPDTVTVEESGPMRAVVRIERYTDYNGINDHKRGYVVRLYAYAGKPWVKVDYQIINAATGPALKSGKWADPYYFESLDLDWNFNLSGTATVKTGLAGDVVDTRPLDSNGVEFAYTMHDNYALRHADGSPNYSSCTDPTTNGTNSCDTAGFMDLSDGTWGVQVAMRNMWELWPSGFQASDPSNYQLQVQLFPDWSGNFYNGAIRSVYWLDDMQAVYKEVLLNFHGATPGDSTLICTARTFDRYPVPTLPVAYYNQTAVTMDLDGKSPYNTRLGTDTLLESNSTSDMNENDGGYRMGWNRWFPPQAYRLVDASDPGDGPAGPDDFIATESPDDFWNAQRWAYSELNNRPQWMGKDYTHADDYATLRLRNVYESSAPSDGYWRASGDNPDYWLGSKENEVRDGEHLWFYHLGNYWYDYNLWVKDWWTWQGEFLKHFIVADASENRAERAQGHTIWAYWQAYRVTGNVSMLDDLAAYAANVMKPAQSPLCGRQTYHQGSASSLEKGFLMRAMGSVLREVKGTDWQNWADLFSIIAGYNEWEYNFGKYSYHPDDNGFCGVGSASGTAWPVPDGAAWYYWITGLTKYKTQADNYIPQAYSDAFMFSPGGAWDGRFAGRTYYAVNGYDRPDSTPPSTINSASATLAGSTLTITWSPPADASYYYIVWADRPISGTQNNNTTSSRNWWAAQPYACGASSCNGSATIPAVTCNPCYAAVFSFDTADNMSAMSNVALSQAGSPQPPPAPQGLRVN